MRQALRVSSAESFLMLFAVWGLGLAGMPADLDQPASVSTAPAVQQPLRLTENLRKPH
ncbi:MAG: hypothetical protein V4650_15500 [Pseudomonadota bacterium]